MDERQVEVERPHEEIRVVRRRQRRAPAEALRQQERQCLKIKNAQRVSLYFQIIYFPYICQHKIHEHKSYCLPFNGMTYGFQGKFI